MTAPKPDFSKIRPIWKRRAERVRQLHERYDPTGAARPRRDPAERAWLEERGEQGPFVEVEVEEEVRRRFWERNR